MNNVWNQPMVPHRTAAKMLLDALGNGRDWAIFLTEDRRFKRRGCPATIPFHRDPDSRRIFYLVENVKAFIVKAKKGNV
jgi:hypothetical protein